MKIMMKNLSLVVMSLMAILVTVFLFRMEVKINSMKVMRVQLMSLRISGRLFRAVEGRNPESMAELLEGEYSFPGEERRRFFVDRLFVEDGVVLDPFANPYGYDETTGIIYSSSSCCENW